MTLIDIWHLKVISTRVVMPTSNISAIIYDMSTREKAVNGLARADVPLSNYSLHGQYTVSHQISRKRSIIRQKLLQSTNRKLYTSFPLVLLIMTFYDIWRSFQSRLSFPCTVSHNCTRYVHRLTYNAKWCRHLWLHSRSSVCHTRYINSLLNSHWHVDMFKWQPHDRSLMSPMSLTTKMTMTWNLRKVWEGATTRE